MEIPAYSAPFSADHRAVCTLLAQQITDHLPGSVSKIWHAHPVWFLDGNPIVGYSKQKAGIRLMFWSGASFDEPLLSIRGGKFKDASVFYNQPADVNPTDLQRWLRKSTYLQWDYKNIVKRKGQLLPLPLDTPPDLVPLVEEGGERAMSK
jgi:hypothetical protein